jgi:DNA polymerase-4
MPLAHAVRLVRDAAILPPNEPLYRRVARALCDLLDGFSPLVEPAACGRVFLDLSGTHRLFGPAQDLAARIERDVRARLRLPSTVALASNKLVSRVAARLLPPASLCDVFPGSEQTFLAPLPAGWLPDLEPPTRRALADLNLARVGEVGGLTLPQLALACGPAAPRLYRQARGVDESPVRPPQRLPVVVVDDTLAEDSNDEALVAAALRALAERTGRILRRRGRAAAELRLRLRYSDGVETARTRRLQRPLYDDLSIWEEVCRLLDQTWKRRLRLRYLELSAGDLASPPETRDLFGPRPGEARRLDLCAALDRLRERHGEAIVRSGTCWAMGMRHARPGTDAMPLWRTRQAGKARPGASGPASHGSRARGIR